MTLETLIYEKKEGLAVITLNRPESLNSINTRMQAELKVVWEDLEKDRKIRVILITGGTKCFSAGADIKETFPPGQSRPSSRDQFKKFEDDDRPFLAAISGFCLGGGLELALCCDLRLATPSAQFGLPELRFGSRGRGHATAAPDCRHHQGQGNALHRRPHRRRRGLTDRADQ